jgi:predicted membrane protein
MKTFKLWSAIILIIVAVILVALSRIPMEVFLMFTFVMLCILGLAGFMVVYTGMLVVTVIIGIYKFYKRG